MWGCIAGLGINLVFIGLVALLMWPVRAELLTLRFAKGYGILWVVAFITAIVLMRIQQFLRVDTDSHYDAYVLSNFGHSVVLLAGWSAFAALVIHDFVSGKSLWAVIVLWVVGVLSSYVAYAILASFYPGPIYVWINLCSALLSFLIFALWPRGGRILFGWFFDLL